MSPTIEKRPAPEIGHPERTARQERESRLEVAVIFTSRDPTIAALRQAAALASRLHARITLVVPQVVPYPLSLTTPPMRLDFSERRLRTMAAECPVENTVRLYLCRDRTDTLRSVLQPRSLVVVGSRKRWWPTSEKRLARELRRLGHEVLLTEME